MPERNNEYVYQPPAKFTEELRQRINNAGFSDEFKQQIKSAQKEEGRKMFERLTHRSKYGIAYTKIAVNESNMIDVGECYTGRIIDRLAAYEDSGLSPEEVQKMARAKVEGRLVVLPCKVGDAVYRIISYKCNAVCNKLNACNSFIYKACKQAEFYVCPGTFQLNDMGWIGKTIFLTCEEAEKALQEGLKC